MKSSSYNKKKNVLDFEFFKLRKKQEVGTYILPNVFHNVTKLSKNSKSLNEADLSNRIHNIKQSVQRINKLISELKQISDKPNK